MRDVSPMETAQAVFRKAGVFNDELNWIEADDSVALEYQRELEIIGREVPFLDEQVFATGHLLRPGIRYGSEEVELLDVPDGIEISRGIYRGMTLFRCFDSKEEKVWRVAHIIETREDVFPDRFFNTVRIRENEYMAAQGFSAMPIEPSNAHSYEDMQHDDCVAEIDDIIFDNIDDRLEMIHKLGMFMNRLLASKSPRTQAVNHQRISLINSRRIFEDAVISAQDFVRGDFRNRDKFSDSTDFCYANVPLDIVPGNLTVLPGYRRFTSPKTKQKYGGEIEVFQKKELYVRGTSEAGEQLLVPIKNIVAVV